MSWFLSFFRKTPTSTATQTTSKIIDTAVKISSNEEKMVFPTIIRQTATKRIPLIKFRRQRQEEALTHSNQAVGQKSVLTKSGPAGVSSIIL